MKTTVDNLWVKLGIDDEIALIQQINDAYRGEASNIGEIIHIHGGESEKYIRSNHSACGFRNPETIERFIMHKVIFPVDASGSRFPYYDPVIDANIYQAMINWDNLDKYSGFLNDMEADEPYGKAKQKQIMKELLQKIDAQSQEKEIVVSEKLLGNYLDIVAWAQAIRSDKSPDHYIRLNETLRDLENDGFLRIISMTFDPSARPQPIEEEIERLKEGVESDEEAYFYSAEHCKVTVELTKSKSKEASLLRYSSENGTEIPIGDLLHSMEEDAEIKPKETLYNDIIQLITKIFQVCTPEHLDIELCNPAKLSKSDSFRAGFDYQATINLLKNKGVFSNFEFIVDDDRSNELKIYRAKVNYQNLVKAAEEFHDDIEARGTLYGFELQKKNLLKLIKDIRVDSKDSALTISESILGSYQKQNRTNNPGGISLIRPDIGRPDIGRPDIQYQFMKALRALEKEGHFIIESVYFDFFAQPKVTAESKKRAIWAIGSNHEPDEYYPPEHCLVNLSFEKKETPEVQGQINEPSPENKRNRSRKTMPECFTEKKYGFIKFYKTGNPIRISRSTSKPYLLLAKLIETYGSYGNTNDAFLAFANKADKKEYDKLPGYEKQLEYAVHKIEIQKKTLQKNKDLQGRFSFLWEKENKAKIKLELE